jgi:HPt (histidine-containing phosphotransfer) domain-containing protein
MTEQMDQHMAAGLDGYLTKPLDQAKLRAMVSRTRVHATPPPQPAPLPLAVIDEGLIDESQIKEIGAVVGEEMLAELMEAFCRDVRAEFDRVVEASTGPDWPGLAIAAHTLRGVAGNLGAVRIAELAAELEAAAKSDGGRTIDEGLIDRLTLAVERTIEVLSRRV